MYIFNKHWDKVDNFRIDKYLMLVRSIFSAVFTVLKTTGYKKADLEWLEKLLLSLFQDNTTAQGLLL